MNRIKGFVLPAQIVLLFVVPAVMLTIVISTIALMFVVLGNASFTDVTTSGPMAVMGFLLYIGFLISMGNWMWEER